VTGRQAYAGIARTEAWPLKVPFVISRSARTHVDVVVVEITDGFHAGRGECQPTSRYGETPAAVVDELTAFFAQRDILGDIFGGVEGAVAGAVAALRSRAAQNALDCALWDLRAKKVGRRVWELNGQAAPPPLQTAYTISLGTPDDMAASAASAVAAGQKLLKLKLGGVGDDDRVRAVRLAVPEVRLIADANEAWSEAMLRAYLPVMAEAGLELLEQPLPAGDDAALASIEHIVPIAADESCHTVTDLPGLQGKYDAVNIKLDKTGGLTEALALERAARDAGFGVMVGCMLGTSLAMAPAMLVAARASVVDLDGALLLAKDRDHKILVSDHCLLLPYSENLWG
jgi:L-alanine-DL-glutamate epimerase-like enolase superfamily enzyme